MWWEVFDEEAGEDGEGVERVVLKNESKEFGPVEHYLGFLAGLDLRLAGKTR
jgi:hypothetical protein